MMVYQNHVLCGSGDETCVTLYVQLWVVEMEKTPVGSQGLSLGRGVVLSEEVRHWERALRSHMVKPGSVSLSFPVVCQSVELPATSHVCPHATILLTMVME